MDEIVELKYTRKGANLSKRKFSQLTQHVPKDENGVRSQLGHLTADEIAKAAKFSNRRVSFLFKNIDDNISEVSNSKRNSLLSNASSWTYKNPHAGKGVTNIRSSLQNEVQGKPFFNINNNNQAVDTYQNLDINDSRFGNPTENNLNLIDINEYVGRNNEMRKVEDSKNAATKNFNYEDELYNEYDDRGGYEEDINIQDIVTSERGTVPYSQVHPSRSLNEFEADIILDDQVSASNTENKFNKDYLRDMNIQLTPPNKNRTQATKQSLEKNGLESFVERNGSGYSFSEHLENEDDSKAEWPTSNGEKYINATEYVEFLRRKKLNLKDPVEQLDDLGDGEFDAERDRKYELDLQGNNTDSFIVTGNNVSKTNKYDNTLDETADLIREHDELSSGIEDLGSIYLSDTSTEDEDFELSESEQTPITTERRLRKSTRIKVPTLDFWRNERIIYKKDPNGPGLTIDGIVKIDKKDDIHEEDFLKRKKNQTKTFTVEQGKKKRGRKKKITKNLGSSNNLNYRIYEKIDAGELPGSDWLKFGIFETEVKTDKNNTHDMIVAFAPDTASETVPTLTDVDDFTVCYTLEKKLSEEDLIKTGFFKFPVNTGKKSKKKNLCQWLQFIVLSGVVEVKIFNDESNLDKEDIMVCVKNSEFCIPTDAHYSLQNIGEDELQLNFTMIGNRNDINLITQFNKKEKSESENSEDEEQEELSRFLDGDGEGSSEKSNIENDTGLPEEKQLFIESSVSGSVNNE